ncbi:hypothetical protein [Micromonospora aurantiaca (nom. illeg.)]|uniref:hypothetical protein n=1 Tax=Micromonospora aurantiaca (nom. illeg.) TaxID=47850 RepID=UPI003401F5EB
MIAIGALGTLAVVVGTKDVDTLSTIALALAVLAFAAQLIVSLAQGMAGAQQVAQTERINADTQAALAALRATSDALLTTQREHFSKVLSAALKRAVPEAVDETLAENAEQNATQDANLVGQLEQLQAAIISRVEEQMQNMNRRAVYTPPAAPRRGPSRLYWEFAAPLESSRIPELSAISDSLTAKEKDRFYSIVNRVLKHTQAGALNPSFPLRIADPNTIPEPYSSLADKGLIAVSSPREVGNGWGVSYQLTPQGVDVARLLTADGKATHPQLLPRVIQHLPVDGAE